MQAEPSTVGVEEEFLLVDPSSGAPVGRNVEVARTANDIGVGVQLELSGCQVETRTGIHTRSPALLRELRHLRRDIAFCAEKNDTRLLAVAASPTVPPSCPVTDTPRYRTIAANFGMLTHRQALCGCHVHIGVPDREIAVQVSNFLRPQLPLFLALTANSAIHGGVDTGFASWRNIQWRRWPSAGPPPHFESIDQYDALVQMMLASGTILDRKMVYWDVRPSTTYPTVEIRISDVPATVEETALLATLVHATVLTARDALAHGRTAPPVAPELLHAAYWRAAQTGLTGGLVDPVDGRVAPAMAVLDDFVARLSPALDLLGERGFVAETLATVRARGNGAVRQAEAFRRRLRAEDVVVALAEATLESCV
ncbi:glutamate--cysteine ligase [Nocardia terpenica]|uniref:Putative glutamate--cysteine ligase 2 n=1 Tax=Nocardia terpenica TaxID=455432 RepID=A0A164LLV0_9NOCA|nr:glutamate--cysteine ligase [Nocardia terpenica]KZM72549.1 carboxylate--amine ligase [Nocardia terpenica]NQE92575.1 glutamate--cysteine ligase [Nocardia terpenica]